VVSSVVSSVEVDPSVVEPAGAVGSVELDPSGVLAPDVLSPLGLVDIELSAVGAGVESVGAVGSPLDGATVDAAWEGGGEELLDETGG
jgi:hypothetical protein